LTDRFLSRSTAGEHLCLRAVILDYSVISEYTRPGCS